MPPPAGHGPAKVRLRFGVEMKKTSVGTARRRFDETNRHAAEIILADPDRYGGSESLAVQWARLVLVRAKPEAEG